MRFSFFSLTEVGSTKPIVHTCFTSVYGILGGGCFARAPSGNFIAQTPSEGLQDDDGVEKHSGWVDDEGKQVDDYPPAEGELSWEVCR